MSKPRKKRINFKCLKKALIEYLDIYDPEIFKPCNIEKEVRKIYGKHARMIGYFSEGTTAHRNLTGGIQHIMFKIPSIKNTYKRKQSSANGVKDSLGNTIPEHVIYYKRR
jgi:hypothetical protein